MNASALITHDIIPLRTSTLGSEALEMMTEFHLLHLPVVNDKQLLGMISEEDILDHDVNSAVGSYHLSLPRVAARESDHIFDVMSLMMRHHLSALPIVDTQENYLGLALDRELLKHFGVGFSFESPGSIIVLQMNKPDYALSEIARIAESEQVTILTSIVSEDDLSNQIQVHIKINNPDLMRVKGAFERFGYEVKAVYAPDDANDVYKDRYESLMHYLGM